MSFIRIRELSTRAAPWRSLRLEFFELIGPVTDGGMSSSQLLKRMSRPRAIDISPVCDTAKPVHSTARKHSQQPRAIPCNSGVRAQPLSPRMLAESDRS